MLRALCKAMPYKGRSYLSGAVVVVEGLVRLVEYCGLVTAALHSCQLLSQTRRGHLAQPLIYFLRPQALILAAQEFIRRSLT